MQGSTRKTIVLGLLVVLIGIGLWMIGVLPDLTPVAY